MATTKSTPKELATKKKTTASTPKRTTGTSTKSGTSKTTKKVNTQATKTINKEITKISKKSPISLVFVVIFLVLGGLAGYFGLDILTKNDTFEMLEYVYSPKQKTNNDGETAASMYTDLESSAAVLFVNEQYSERGTLCISFGRDISKEVTTTYFYREDISFEPKEVPSVDTSKSGFYYALYKVNDFKFKDVELIRNIIVVEVEIDG